MRNKNPNLYFELQDSSFALTSQYKDFPEEFLEKFLIYSRIFLHLVSLI